MKKLAVGMLSLAVCGSVSGAEPQCSSTALSAASYINKIGWGQVDSEPLEIMSGVRRDITSTDPQTGVNAE
jgi:hypothetical protein